MYPIHTEQLERSPSGGGLSCVHSEQSTVVTKKLTNFFSEKAFLPETFPPLTVDAALLSSVVIRIGASIAMFAKLGVRSINEQFVLGRNEEAVTGLPNQSYHMQCLGGGGCHSQLPSPL